MLLNASEYLLYSNQYLMQSYVIDGTLSHEHNQLLITMFAIKHGKLYTVCFRNRKLNATNVLSGGFEAAN